MLGPLRIVAFSHEVPLVMQEGIMPFPLSQLEHFWTPLIMTTTNLGLISVAVLVLLLGWWLCRKTPDVLLLDFACFKPPPSLQLSYDKYMMGTETTTLAGEIGFSLASLEFQRRISETNGLSNSVYGPPAMHIDGLDSSGISTLEARRETCMVFFGAAQEVLGRTGLGGQDIDIVIVTSSLFNPEPSLSSMVARRFGMRPDMEQYDLAGMGCSAATAAVCLASQLLKASKSGKYALLLSSENITHNQYYGSDRDKLIPNTLFRMGASAAILTNKGSELKRCKYRLAHIVRTHIGADATAYRCIYQTEDGEGNKGVTLSKDIVKVAARALQKNLQQMGPLVLPYNEQLKYLGTAVLCKMGVRKKTYLPDFCKAFRHFSFHAGGRGVIEGLGCQLGLTKADLEPSFSSLYWYGNTSSAAIWYGLGYAESQQGVKKGDKVWMLGFGSGFKVGSCVWVALKSFRADKHTAWQHITQADTEKMWSELERLGVNFVNGTLPPKKKNNHEANATCPGSLGANLSGPKKLGAADRHDSARSL